MEKSSRILITGSSGLIGSALVRLLKKEGYKNLLIPSHQELDFCNQSACYLYFHSNNPDYVFHLAAAVGGIQENIQSPAMLISVNTIMHCNILEACRAYNVRKLLFPGSACAYPANALQPIKESSLLHGIPEITNLAYAIAKINGIVMAQSYARQYDMSVVLPMVANTYGKNDRSSHVIPMMMKKFQDAHHVIIWGTGKPLREFIYADDVASAFLFLMLNYDSSEIVNVGTGVEYSIAALAHNIKHVMNYKGTVGWDETKPDGIGRKCLDSSRIRAMGWEPKITLEEGLRRIIDAESAK